MAANEYRPGAVAPSSGEYEELNIFGSPTGKVVVAAKGDPLPAAAVNFTWRSLGQHSVAKLRMRAADYRRAAEAAITAAAQGYLRTLADRLDTFADQQERGGLRE